MAKSKASIGKILKLFAALLAVAAFVMMFIDQLKFKVGNTSTVVDYVLWGHKTKTILGETEGKGAIASGISYIICAVCALGLLVSLLTKKNGLTVISALLLIVAAVFIFLTKTFYLSANEITVEAIKDTYKLAVGPWVGGITAGLGGLFGLAGVIAK